MFQLFKHPSTLVVIQEPAVFSNGLAVKCDFVNGWLCSSCGFVTEHNDKDGVRICTVCKSSKPYLRSLTVEHIANHRKLERSTKCFHAAIAQYICQAEFEAIQPLLLNRQWLTVYIWGRVREHLFSSTFFSSNEFVEGN